MIIYGFIPAAIYRICTNCSFGGRALPAPSVFGRARGNEIYYTTAPLSNEVKILGKRK